MSKLQKYIAIGNRGTAFAFLDEKQAACLKLGEQNLICAKIERTEAQIEARNAGRHQGVLWADSCSFVSSRSEGTFWIGTLEQALSAKLVIQATIELKTEAGRKVSGVCYVRASFDAAKHWDKYVATDCGKNGRIETSATNDKDGMRNSVYRRNVQAIVLGAVKTKVRKEKRAVVAAEAIAA